MTAYIALGSNQGDRCGMIQAALQRLREDPDVTVCAESPMAETKPIGPIPQPDFINAVVRIETTHPALALLDRLLAIERSLGRVRKERWGPRTIDLDILYYGDQTIDVPRLTVPHPEIGNRPFLQKLLETVKPKLTQRHTETKN